MTISRADLETIEILNAKRQNALLLLPNIAHLLYELSRAALKRAELLPDMPLQRPRVKTKSDEAFLMERYHQIVLAWEDESKTEESKAKNIAKILEDTKLRPYFVQSQCRKINLWFSKAVAQCTHMHGLDVCDYKTFRDIMIEAKNFDSFITLLKEKTEITPRLLRTLKQWIKVEYGKFESICSIVPNHPGKSFKMLEQAEKNNLVYQQAIHKLVEKSSPLVKKIPMELNNTDSYADKRIAAGLSAIPEQIETFDPRKDYEFSIWAHRRIRREIVGFTNRKLHHLNEPENVHLRSVAKEKEAEPKESGICSPCSIALTHEPIVDGMTGRYFLGHNNDPLAEMLSMEGKKEISNISDIVSKRKIDAAKQIARKARFGLNSVNVQSAGSPFRVIVMEAAALLEISSILADNHAHPVVEKIKSAAETVTGFVQKEIRDKQHSIPRLKFDKYEFLNAMSAPIVTPGQAKLIGEPVIMIDNEKKQFLIFNADLNAITKLSFFLESTGYFSEARMMDSGVSIQYCGADKYPQLEQFIYSLCESFALENSNAPSRNIVIKKLEAE